MKKETTLTGGSTWKQGNYLYKLTGWTGFVRSKDREGGKQVASEAIDHALAGRRAEAERCMVWLGAEPGKNPWPSRDKKEKPVRKTWRYRKPVVAVDEDLAKKARELASRYDAAETETVVKSDENKNADDPFAALGL